MVEIEIFDAIHAAIDKPSVELIKPCLSYDSVFWKKGPFGSKRESYRKHVFISKGKLQWKFYTGLVPRVIQFCKGQNLPYHVEGIENAWPDVLRKSPVFGNIKFHPFQENLINKALFELRGVIKAPTGSGKTIIQLGIIKALEEYNILLLAHTISIVEQTYRELQKFGFKNLQIVTGEHGRSPLMGKVVVSTMQSFKMYDDFDSSSYFHGVIIDEAHHVTDEDGTYGSILQRLLAPIRLGFTATTPTEPKAQFALEGLIGPLIGKLSIQEAGKLDILAKPKIKLVKTTFQTRIEDLKSYESVYTEGVVNNRSRNREILDLMWDYTNKGMTVLILVTRIDHGSILQTMAETRFGMMVPFVQGETTSEVREDFKKRLDSKELKAIIATTVWREGINIPSLNVVINAAGGKSEIMTLQAVGRGLRKTKDKEEVIIVDFFDPSHFFLIRHFGERVTLYMDNGWL